MAWAFGYLSDMLGSAPPGRAADLIASRIPPGRSLVMIAPWPLAMKTLDKINNADHQQKIRTSNNKGQYEIDIIAMIAISNRNTIEHRDNKPIREARMQTSNVKNNGNNQHRASATKIENINRHQI